MMRRSIIEGCAGYLPERIVTNEELAARVDTSDEWVRVRTGIQERRIAADDQQTSDLATQAAERALANAGMRAEEIDLILVATTTPDNTFPSTAVKVQAQLGATGGPAFDIQAVCAGFVYGLAAADGYLRTGGADSALVIGAEIFSRILDWEDRSTCVLFGDGAGAVVLRAANGDGSNADRGILSHHLHSDGTLYDLLYVDGGVSTTQKSGYLRMAGQEVFRHAVNKLSDVLLEGLAANDMTATDVDWLVPHQANKRIIDATARKLGLPTEKVILTVDKHANTSAASIPLALAEAEADGRLKAGDVVLIEAIGGGLAWGSSVIRW
ncbi:MAG: beta-ketoacyl-ACP synthase III [Alphaproteobacteria bacterium]|nr:beta-ketoacyl-ACP synthase III [Alphaproteobacteria bacterium]